jgi:antitoxin component YwqK of YwqJK toxin-antitoxin module
MIRILATTLLTLCLTASDAFATSLVELVERGGVYFKKFTNEPLNGKVDEELHQGAYKNGKREAPWVGYWPNGQLLYMGTYKNGKREGPWVAYYDDGTKDEVSSGSYRDGKKFSG